VSTVFRLDSSIRAEGSVTRAVASTFESALVEDLGTANVVRRDIGLDPLDSRAWALSAFAGFVPEEQWTPERRAAVALAHELADELEAADAYVFAVPFYNFGVSQHVKTWVDLLMTDPRFSTGAQTIVGRPAFLVLARGGGYGPGTPREGWDHATAWLLRIFSDIWGLDVQVIETELTLAEVTPAMSHLRELAAVKVEEAHSAAHKHGKSLAVVLTGAS
jgi:FMN-dependent NADH-azoreductase